MLIVTRLKTLCTYHKSDKVTVGLRTIHFAASQCSLYLAYQVHALLAVINVNENDMALMYKI